MITVDDYKVLGIDVTSADIKDFDESQDIIICDLLDENGSVLASDRYFFLGEQPFGFGEKELAELYAEPEKDV